MSYKIQHLENKIQTIIATVIEEEITNDDLKKATITSCRLSKDYSFATIYVIFPKKYEDEGLEKLNNLSGFFRTKLAKVSQTRRTPVVTFKKDDLLEKANDLEKLLEKNK